MKDETPSSICCRPMSHADPIIEHSTMPPYDEVGCPAMKFKYGKDCLCENQAACRGLTAAFSMLGNDPRSGFVRIPNYKEHPESQFYVERNMQREAYLRYLLPDHPVEKETLAKDVALHHFHPRVVARLVSNLQKNIPRTVPERELIQLGLILDERDKLKDEDGNYTGRCIFAPCYPIEKSKQDLKRLLRLCRALNQDKKDKSSAQKSSPKPKKKKKRRFDPDIRNEDDLAYSSSRDDDRDEDRDEDTSDERLDTLADHNIHSLLESIIRLEPIPEEGDDVKVMELMPTLDTDLESESEEDEDEEDARPNMTATVSMQIGLEKLHTGKGKNRMTKITKRAPSPFFEISVLHDVDKSGYVAIHAILKCVLPLVPLVTYTSVPYYFIRDTIHPSVQIYRSYPLTDTKNGTWDPIESLDLGVDVHTPEDLNFRITVYDLAVKGGDHLLIGTSQVNALDLLTTSHMSIPILRDDKVKGFLKVASFQLHTFDNVCSTSESADSSWEHTPQVGESLSEETCDCNLPLNHSAEQESPFELHYTYLDSPPRPTLSMQVSHEKLCSRKGKNLANKVRKKAPNPFFEFSVLHKNGWYVGSRLVTYVVL